MKMIASAGRACALLSFLVNGAAGAGNWAGNWPGGEALTPRLEQLQFIIPCDQVKNFVKADDATWTAFLARQPGFVRKTVFLDQNYTSSSGGVDECSVWTTVHWASLELWKVIDSDDLTATEAAFAAAFGSDPVPQPYPAPGGDGSSYTGLEILLDVPPPLEEPFPARARLAQQAAAAAAAAKQGHVGNATGKWAPAEEVIRSEVKSCDAADVDAFVAADNATWTQYLATCPGFVRKVTFLQEVAGAEADAASTCYVWTRSRWASRADWDACDADGDALAATAEAFAAMLGYAPPMQRWPFASDPDSGGGGDFSKKPFVAVLRERELPRGPRTLAVAGNDVVAYQTLVPGVDHDVRGSPSISRVLPSAALFAKAPGGHAAALAALHPADYEFWFSSEANAALFDEDPMRYVPAFGGHCTHGIATLVDGDLTPQQMADGRLAFVCVNTTTWGKVVNGTLYMNSCGMYEDFMNDPEGDIAKASKIWEGWFGAPYGSTGPINDACFQDGYTWGGPPNWVAGLLPPRCNIM